LDTGNYPRRCHEQSYDNEDGNDCPGKFHLIAAVDLRRFLVVVCSLSESHDRIDEKTENNYEYRCGDR